MSSGCPAANCSLMVKQILALHGKSILSSEALDKASFFADWFGIGNVKFHTGPQRKASPVMAIGILTDLINDGYELYLRLILLTNFVTPVIFWQLGAL